MRTAVAYALTCALLVFGGRWAGTFVIPIVVTPVSGSIQATVYSLVVISALVCGLIGGGIFALLTRPNQLRHASLFAGGVALLSFAQGAVFRFSPIILTFEALWVLPFVTAALACAAISRAQALERLLAETPGPEVR